jgi:hypothetical protein
VGVMLAALSGVGGRFLLASDGSDDEGQKRVIEGVWQGRETIVDCSTQAEFFSFATMEIYLHGGGLLVESSSPAAIRATGMGAWRHARESNFTSAYQFFTYDPVGNPAGVLTITAKIQLAADAKTFQASSTAVVTDFAGNVLEHVCGKREAARFD